MNRTQVRTLTEASKLLHEAKMFASTTLKINPIALSDLRFVAFSDASSASEKSLDSHQGMMIMSAHRDIGDNKTSQVNPILWHSKKIQKVAVSTLSAEAMALAGATDMLTWVRLYWAWLMDSSTPWRKADEILMKLPNAFAAIPPECEESSSPPSNAHAILARTSKNHKNFLATDCKSLFDLVSRTAPPACQEFRTLLQAKLVREHLQNGIQIRWVPSGAQIADGLTKPMDGTLLRECLRVGRYSLHDEGEILRQRSDARVRLKWLHTQDNDHGRGKDVSQQDTVDCSGKAKHLERTKT